MTSLKKGSCERSATLSEVNTISVSKVVTPKSMAFSIAGIVFSGINPLAPRCPCLTKLIEIVNPVFFFEEPHAAQKKVSINKALHMGLSTKNFDEFSLSIAKLMDLIDKAVPDKERKIKKMRALACAWRACMFYETFSLKTVILFMRSHLSKYADIYVYTLILTLLQKSKR